MCYTGCWFVKHRLHFYPCSRVKAEGGDFFGYTDAEKILPDLDPSPSDIILPAGHRPALATLHHSKVQLNHLIRRTHAQTPLDVIVRLSLILSQLPLTIQQ